MPGKEVTFRKSAYIYIEGDEDSGCIYIIKSGTVRLSRTNESITNIKSNAGVGDIIGYVSSMCGRARIESATAKTDSLLISFSRESFLSLLQKKQDIAFKILGNLAAQLGAFNSLILNRNRSQDVIPTGTKLFNLGKSYFDRGNGIAAVYVLFRYRELYPGSGMEEKASQMMEALRKKGIKYPSSPAVSGNDRIFPDKSLIFCESEPGEELYIIREGKVKILKSDKNSEIMLAILGEGDIFGELAIISDKPRNATAVSCGNCRLTPVNKQALVMLMKSNPGIFNRIFISLCQRIWFTYIRMEAGLYRKPVTMIYAFLENKLKEENISLKSRSGHTFSFGIEELFSMLELSQEKNMKTVDTILEDDNL